MAVLTRSSRREQRDLYQCGCQLGGAVIQNWDCRWDDDLGAVEGLAFVLARECLENASGIVNRALSQADRNVKPTRRRPPTGPRAPVFCTLSQVQLATLVQFESESTVDVMVQHNRKREELQGLKWEIWDSSYRDGCNIRRTGVKLSWMGRKLRIDSGCPWSEDRSEKVRTEG
jgi:hypothetical protein